jgi:hypothetical protein
MKRQLLFTICLSLFSQSGFSFDKLDFLQTRGKQVNFSDTSIIKEKKPHSPHKASVLSAVLPGAGQIYNRKYWKAPIVWAGLGTFAYMYTYNAKNTNLVQKELNARRDNDPSALNPDFETIPDNFLRNERNTFRNNRDLSMIGFLAFYAIQIVDAAVDAHLYNFDVDRSLSLRAKPSTFVTGTGFTPGMNLGLSFTF